MQRVEDIVAAIGKSSLMGGLGPETLTELVEQAEVVKLADGAVLFRQGDHGDAAYLVLGGACEVIFESPLGEVRMATIDPEHIVGETAVFADLPRTATVRAQGETILLRLERAGLAQAIAGHPQTAFGLIAAMGKRIQALNRPLALLSQATLALERDDADSETLARLMSDANESDPFAAAFQRLVREMEGKQARRQELAVAARMQQSILPRPLDLGRGWGLAAAMKPARFIGGDFYDWFPTREGRIALAVADVSGKGIPAALFMAVSRTGIRAAMAATPRIDMALSAVNSQLEAENDEAMFVTVFLAEFDPATGKLDYVNAGHCDGLVRRRDGSLQALGTTGPAVALRAGVAYRTGSVEIAPGELLLLTSDGVNEAFDRDENQFGDDRLRALLAGAMPKEAGSAVAVVTDAVAAFAGAAEQSDDITVLALLRS